MCLEVLGYYNRRGIDPSSFLKEIRFIASDPDEDHFFNVTDEAALKDIVDALGERIFSLEGQFGKMRFVFHFSLQRGCSSLALVVCQEATGWGGASACRWRRRGSPPTSCR